MHVAASIPRVTFRSGYTAFAAVTLSLLLAACGPGASTVAPTSLTISTPTAAPSPSAAPSRAPTPAPDDLALLAGEHPDVPPGTWRWTRFEPGIEMTVEAGWKIGHRHDEYFDLFRGETFPAIGFGRFADVFTSQTTTVAATDPEAVVAALAANPGVELDDLGTTTVAGLPTRVVDVRVTQAQTHLFRGEDELNSDPGFVQRCHLIAVPGGVLLVSVLTDEGNLAGALALTESVIESIEVESAP